MQRREEQAGEHDHQAAEAGDELVLHQLELPLQCLQVLLGGNALSWIASKISVAMRSAFWRSILASARALVRESRSVNGRVSAALRIRVRRKAGAEPAVSGCTPYPSRGNSSTRWRGFDVRASCNFAPVAAAVN